MNRTAIKKIWLSDTAIFIESNDGKQGYELFSDYKRLKKATAEERNNYTVSYFGIHWPDLDEDLSFDGFFNKSDNCIEASEKTSII